MTGCALLAPGPTTACRPRPGHLRFQLPYAALPELCRLHRASTEIRALVGCAFHAAVAPGYDLVARCVCWLLAVGCAEVEAVRVRLRLLCGSRRPGE